MLPSQEPTKNIRVGNVMVAAEKQIMKLLTVQVDVDGVMMKVIGSPQGTRRSLIKVVYPDSALMGIVGVKNGIRAESAYAIAHIILVEMSTEELAFTKAAFYCRRDELLRSHE